MSLKSAYEIALEKSGGLSERKLSDEAKKRLAEAEAKFTAQAAELEITFAGRIAAARAAGDPEALEALEAELARLKAEVAGRKASEKAKIRSRVEAKGQS